MIKLIRRVLALLASVAVVLGALKVALNWVARSYEGSHEVFADDDFEYADED
jgi:hypothetical protein